MSGRGEERQERAQRLFLLLAEGAALRQPRLAALGLAQHHVAVAADDDLRGGGARGEGGWQARGRPPSSGKRRGGARARTFVACENTVVICMQPLHRTSMKKELGDCEGLREEADEGRWKAAERRQSHE